VFSLCEPVSDGCVTSRLMFSSPELCSGARVWLRRGPERQQDPRNSREHSAIRTHSSYCHSHNHCTHRSSQGCRLC
jgi:hypothetical protein